MAQLECRSVTFAYDGGAVLSGVSFSLNAGDYLCIVGENGSGKSTLVKGLLRLKAPLSGKIELGDGLLPREIGYLPQQTSAQRDFPSSVYEVVLSGRLSGLARRAFFTKDDRREVLDKLKLMGITSLKNRCYQELSGGQQQRVLLARALCATKKLILLDEPVAGLDPMVTSELYALIEKINHELGISVIMVSHDITAAVKYASHILHLSHDGFFFGQTQDYICSELGRRFLGGGKDA